ncbi:AI-2E family transporter [Citreimonas salinaria]|uniref:Predicted PurR-regulated permease PerM n=1 Tax=Citreimonas salinaria TaxID=321339 RepID=A0A1H3J6F0_9RHOB|nr:AI-2E family transporter [Citreimonas salinaria]SDY35018.1 Predicted PurR-regulated permease PerM [Citreimonas salinaria]
MKERQADTPPYLRIVALTLVAILAILLGSVLRSMANVAIPVVMAIFVTLAILPLDRRVAAQMPGPLRWLSRAVVMIVLLICIGLFVGGLVYCIQRIAAQVPELTEQLGSILPEPDEPGPAGLWQDLRDLIDAQSGSLSSTMLEEAANIAQATVNAMGLMLTGIVLVLFLVLLAVSEGDLWRSKVAEIATGPRAGGWFGVFETLGATLRQFILVRTVLGVVTAALYSAWLWFFGIELLLVWALLTFLLNFIPNLGSLLSGLLPTFYALLTMDLGTAAVIAAGLLVIEQVMGNWVDPRMQGRRVSLSPLVILIAVLFWSALWGVAGAFLATPMTLSVMVIANNIPGIRSVALLLSNECTFDDLDEALDFHEPDG